MKPLALLGNPELYAPLRTLCDEIDLGFVPLVTPHHNPQYTIESLIHLGYVGALIADDVAESYLSSVSRYSPEAKRVGKIDCYSTFGGLATHTLEEVMLTWVERNVKTLGAKLMLLGDQPELKACTQLARLGFSSVVVAASHPSHAVDIAKHIPQGAEHYAITLSDYSFSPLLAQQDVIIISDFVGNVPFAPYQQVIDLNGFYPHLRNQVQMWDTRELHAERLSKQLEFVSGRKIAPSLVQWALQHSQNGL